MGKYTKFTDSSHQFRFNLKADNGEIILSSEAYTSKAGRDNGIESTQINSQIDGQYDNREARNGDPYFVLKARNGEILGTSETYSSTQARDKGKASVKANGSTSTIVEE